MCVATLQDNNKISVVIHNTIQMSQEDLSRRYNIDIELLKVCLHSYPINVMEIGSNSF